MQVQRVDISHVHQVWPLMEHFIAEALEHSKDDYTLEQAKTLVAVGNWTLIVAVDDAGVQGAATVSFSNRPDDRVAFITSTGGKNIIDKATFNQLQSIAKHYGATKIQAMARPAMVRLLQTCNMKPGNTLMEYEL